MPVMATDPRPAPAEPPVFGSLGHELARALTPLVTVVSVVAAGVAIAVAALGLSVFVIGIAPSVGYAAAIWTFAAVASILVVLAVAVMGIVPPLLLRGQDRTATVVHSWVGAREVRRAFGRPARVVGAIGSRDDAARWLERTPPTEALRPVRFEAFIFLGRLDEARAEVDRFRRRTPLEEFRYLEAHALIDEQSGIPLDVSALREAIARIPSGLDRTEAEASLAVNLARSALPDGDWRGPLLAVRPLIPGSDAGILVRDFGLTTFEVLLRRIGLPIILLFVALAIILSIAPTFT
jgi:hypothetical protein